MSKAAAWPREVLPLTPLEARYLMTAPVELIGTWASNIAAFDLGGGYLRGWFANPAASSAATPARGGAVAAVFMVVEARRLGMGHPWLYVVGTLRARSAHRPPGADLGSPGPAKPALATAHAQSVGLPR